MPLGVSPYVPTIYRVSSYTCVAVGLWTGYTSYGSSGGTGSTTGGTGSNLFCNNCLVGGYGYFRMDSLVVGLVAVVIGILGIIRTWQVQRPAPPGESARSSVAGIPIVDLGDGRAGIPIINLVRGGSGSPGVRVDGDGVIGRERHPGGDEYPPAAGKSSPAV